MYKRLKAYAVSQPMRQRLREFIGQKMVKEFSVKRKIPLKDALAVLVLDDFWDDAKNIATKGWDKLK